MAVKIWMVSLYVFIPIPSDASSLIIFSREKAKIPEMQEDFSAG